MTNQKQVLIVSQKPIAIKSPKALLVSKLNKTVVYCREGLEHINLRQWLLLLFLNSVSLSFIVLAYLCCADS